MTSSQRWLSYYEQPVIWLVKEKEMALVIVPFIKEPHQGYLFQRDGGYIHILRESRAQPEMWWTDARGNGHDGKPILEPVGSAKHHDWKITPIQQKQLIERSIASIKDTIQKSEQDVIRLQRYLGKYVADAALIQDIIE